MYFQLQNPFGPQGGPPINSYGQLGGSLTTSGGSPYVSSCATPSSPMHYHNYWSSQPESNKMKLD